MARLQRQQQVFPHRLFAVHARELELDRQTPSSAPYRRPRADVFVAKQQLAGIAWDSPSDHMQKRALARAVGSYETVDMAVLD